MNLKFDWLVDALTSQVRLLERREGRPVVAVQLSVPPPDGPTVSDRLRERFPDAEVIVLERGGRPQVLRVSFALEAS
jgi:hypothetical protein